jgi:hypothetical protein
MAEAWYTEIIEEIKKDRSCSHQQARRYFMEVTGIALPSATAQTVSDNWRFWGKLATLRVSDGMFLVTFRAKRLNFLLGGNKNVIHLHDVALLGQLVERVQLRHYLDELAITNGDYSGRAAIPAALAQLKHTWSKTCARWRTAKDAHDSVDILGRPSLSQNRLATEEPLTFGPYGHMLKNASHNVVLAADNNGTIFSSLDTADVQTEGHLLGVLPSLSKMAESDEFSANIMLAPDLRIHFEFDTIIGPLSFSRTTTNRVLVRSTKAIRAMEAITIYFGQSKQLLDAFDCVQYLGRD